MERRRLVVEGCVQGVGFRPFVHELALRLELAGHVRNDPAGVVIEAEGPASRLDRFQRDLARLAPPLAAVQAIRAFPLPFVTARKPRAFRILTTRGSGRRGAEISPDTAPCEPWRAPPPPSGGPPPPGTLLGLFPALRRFPDRFGKWVCRSRSGGSLLGLSRPPLRRSRPSRPNATMNASPN
jgi:acylphosphatase